MNENLFCPFIKEECKKDECVMRKHDTCLISVFLISNIFSAASAGMDNNSKVSDTNIELVQEFFSGYAVALDSDPQDVPNGELDAMFSKSAGELADEIIQFAKDERLINDDESYLTHEIEDLFWSNKGLESSNKELPLKYRILKKKAWIIASTKINSDAKSNRVIQIVDRDSLNNEKLIASLSNEVLAEQLLSFAKEAKLGQDDQETINWETTGFFWKSKGLQNTSNLSASVGIKIKQVEKLAREKLNAKIFSASDEELSQELALYAKKKAGREKGQGVNIYSVANAFWRTKGLGYGIESPEIQQKKENIQSLAQEIVDKDFNDYKDQRLEAEKKELPSLIQSCVEWARSSGRRNVTLKDVEYFMLEKNIDILDVTKRALYLGTNNELKTRKRAINSST